MWWNWPTKRATMVRLQKINTRSVVNSIPEQNNVEKVNPRKKLPIDNEAMDNRVRRKAAVIGDLRRKKLGNC